MFIVRDGVGGPYDFSVIPSPNWSFGFGTSLGLGGLESGQELFLTNLAIAFGL